MKPITLPFSKSVICGLLTGWGRGLGWSSARTLGWAPTIWTQGEKVFETRFRSVRRGSGVTRECVQHDFQTDNWKECWLEVVKVSCDSSYVQQRYATICHACHVPLPVHASRHDPYFERDCVASPLIQFSEKFESQKWVCWHPERQFYRCVKRNFERRHSWRSRPKSSAGCIWTQIKVRILGGAAKGESCVFFVRHCMFFIFYFLISLDLQEMHIWTFYYCSLNVQKNHPRGLKVEYIATLWNRRPRIEEIPEINRNYHDFCVFSVYFDVCGSHSTVVCILLLLNEHWIQSVYPLLHKCPFKGEICENRRKFAENSQKNA